MTMEGPHGPSHPDGAPPRGRPRAANIPDPWSLVSGRTSILGTVLLVSIVFLPTLGFGFVYDDHWTILDNGFLRRPEDWWMLLGPEAARRNVPDPFRPTLVLFDGLAYQAFGLHALAQHGLSLALHGLVTVLVARWLERLGAPLPLRIATAAVFGTLAIHAEAVAVVSYREDLLAAALGLAALLLAERSLVAARTPRRLAFACASALCMSLAVGAKTSAAPLPVLWWLAHRLLPWQAPRRGVTPVALALTAGVGLALLHTTLVVGSVVPYGHDPARIEAHRIGLSPVLAASVQIHLAYLQRIVCPFGLGPEYVDAGAAWTDPATVLALGALAGLLGLALARARRAPVLAFAVLGCFVLALPTSNLFPMPNMQADRFVYLTSLPAALGLAALLLTAGRELARKGLPPLATVAPLLAMLVIQGAVAQGAAAAYRSDTRLWQIALRRAPASARAHGVMGELMIARLRDPMALDARPRLHVLARTHCTLAERLDPADPIGPLCRARLAALERDWITAHASFEIAAARLTARRERAWLGLASTVLDRPDLPYADRVERALAHLAAAEHEYPYVAEVFAVSARLHHRLGHPEAALDRNRRASELRPERWDVVVQRLELELDLGHHADAQRSWSAAEPVLRHADPTTQAALRSKLGDARRLFGTVPPTP